MIRNTIQRAAMSDVSLVEQIKTRLRAEGGRMTSQRRLILETLEDSPDHPTAEEIFELARRTDHSLHLSTVYRTLRWLEEEGFVNPRWFEDERRQERFDTVSDQNRNHDHFRCRVCNTIIEFSEPLVDEIKAAYQNRFGGRVESATLTFYGICEHCLELE
jgi:Fur family transcriptional regulator, ferric uptake regulator